MHAQCLQMNSLNFYDQSLSIYTVELLTKDRPKSQGTMQVLKDGWSLLRGLFALIFVMKRKCGLFKKRPVSAEVVSEHF